MTGEKHINRMCLIVHIHFIFAHIRAYAICSYTYSVDFWVLLGCVMISFSLTSGRMRYAPTPVRLIFGFYWIGGWIRFRSREGVCDTPLHLFDYCRGQIQLIIIPVRLLSGMGWRTNLLGGLQWDDECTNALGP